MSNWQLKRLDTNEVIELDQDMIWLDEMDYSDIAGCTPKYSITGAQVLQKSRKKAGRPITLGGEWVWIKRGDFLKMQEWSNIAPLKMQLTRYDGTKYNVSFRHHETPIDAKPVHYETPEPADAPYTGSINLMTV